MVTNEVTFYLAALALAVLTVESCIKLLKRDSFGITVAVYVTVFAWYFVDPFLNPDQYDYLPSFLLGQSYGEVLLFLIAFRVFTPAAIRWIVSRRASGVFDVRLTPDQLLKGAAAIWFLLLIFGICRMDGDVMGALLPLDGRAGATMWGRGAVESGASGFLISFAGYLFIAVTASLGFLVFFQRSIGRRLLAGAMFAITLPYFFFAGARNQFLAVVMPFLLAYLFYKRHLLILRLAILAIAFFSLNAGFKFMTAYRLHGFRDVLAGENSYEIADNDSTERGLNMIQELCFVNTYLGTGAGSVVYGAGYLNELLNFIPRMIWPSKPLLGIDYAKWRGFESDDDDGLGVNTTISSGMIGGGVLNFGQIFGPIAAAMLMALWTGLLVRWWEQRKSLLRLMLFMLRIGLTFNLGRDITLLVLWPMIFAYCFVRFAENLARPRIQHLPELIAVAPADAPQRMPAVAGRLSQ